MTSVRKSLHPLQSAAGDKENLVGPGRMPLTFDNLKGSLREVNENDKTPDAQSKLIKRKKTTNKGVQAGHKSSSSSVSVEDLTSDAVSQNYWEGLAEQRRIALESALKENQELHVLNEGLRKRVTLLEEENRIAKEMLTESETLVDVLKEMLVDADETADENSLIDNSYEV